MNLRLSFTGALTGLFLAVLPCFGQVLFSESFPYATGTLLTSAGFTAHSGAGSTPVAVASGSLVFPSYEPMESGNAATLTGGSGTREDVNHQFTGISFGSMFVSFLVNVTSMSTSGDYFFHLGPTNLSTVFKAKVLAKTNTAGALAFGISKTSSTDSVISWTPFAYAPGTTYLLVLKYTFNSGSTSDDRVDLWVDPPLDGAEPASTVHQTDGGSDASEIGSFALRQGSVSYSAKIDAIRIRLSWFDNPLPIQLVRFAGSVSTKGITLAWTTASELNCYGFEVERSGSRQGPFTKASGVIAGHGTTTTPESYSFLDSAAVSGRYYRLRQIDLDQTEHISDAIQVGTTSVDERLHPASQWLLGCYPNPFNPRTVVSFQLPVPNGAEGPAARNVRLAVYDLLGREVTVLLDETKLPGTYDIAWNAAGFSSGVYLVKMTAGAHASATKIVLMK
jgi:hypothetical protein